MMTTAVKFTKFY